MRDNWRRILGYALVLAVGGLVGASIAAAGDTESPGAPEAVTKTVTEEVTTTPDACLAALDTADVIIDVMSDYATLVVQYPEMMGDLARAAAAFDADGIDAVTEQSRDVTRQTNELTARLEGLEYGLEAEACRAESL